MVIRDAEALVARPPLARRVRVRLFREWCFAKALGRRFRLGGALLLLAMLSGVAGFRTTGLPWDESAWRTWALLCTDLPNDMPVSRLTRTLTVVLPVTGLVVITQGLVELVVMLRDRRRNERSWSETMAQSSKDHVVVVGLGRLGYRCWRLLDQLGVDVVVIERDTNAQFLEEVRREGAALLVGDGRSDQLLESANVAKARSIVLATNDDLANLEMALDARRMNPQISVILRLFDQGLANKVSGAFEIHTAMSQSALAAPAFAMAAFDASIITSFVVDGQLFVMQRWRVGAGSPIAGRSLGAIRRELGFGVVQLTRAGGSGLALPSDDVVLAAGDGALVQAPLQALLALREKGLSKDLVAAPPAAAALR